VGEEGRCRRLPATCGFSSKVAGRERGYGVSSEVDTDHASLEVGQIISDHVELESELGAL